MEQLWLAERVSHVQKVRLDQFLRRHGRVYWVGHITPHRVENAVELKLGYLARFIGGTDRRLDGSPTEAKL